MLVPSLLCFSYVLVFLPECNDFNISDYFIHSIRFNRVFLLRHIYKFYILALFKAS